MMNKSDTIAIIRSLLSSTKSTCSVWTLNLDFKKETGIDIPLFGYGSLSDFLQSIPDTVRVSGMYPIQQVQLVENEKSGHIVSLVNRTSARRNKSGRGQSRKAVIYNWNKNVQRSPHSTMLSDLERMRSLKISPLTNSQTLSNSLNCSLESSNSQVSLKNFLGVEETIPAIDIKLHAQVGGFVEICPNYVYNPHEFYFQFRIFKRKFSDFIEKLHGYYENNEYIPEVADGVIKPKLTCAVLHKIRDKTAWHRGEITQIFGNSHVLVTFMDYGCRAKISRRNLKLLHRDFTSLPKQAVLGSLANVRPSKGESRWSSDAVDRFSALVLDEDLIAGVVGVDAEACSMTVALSNTKGSEFHINDTLVKEGHAEFVTNVLNNYTVDKLSAPASVKSHKDNSRRSEATKKEYTKEEILKLLLKNPLVTAATPTFFFSSAFSNKRLQKLLSATEGE